MKFLIANYEFNNFFGGTQTWSLTMLQALRSLGHSAYLDAHVEKWDSEIAIDKAPRGFRPDVILVNGNQTLKKYKFENAVVCQVCHGILPDLEQPYRGADLYFAVSEEVEHHLQVSGFTCNAILRNPIIVPPQSTIRPIADNLETIAIISRRRQHELSHELAKHFNVLNLGNPPSRNIWEEAKTADLVIGTGRVAYEAMSKGKAVIVSGTNSGRQLNEWMDGYVTADNFYSIRKNNCSGRHYKKRVSNISDLLLETMKYTRESGIQNYNLVSRENDSQIIASYLVHRLNSLVNRRPTRYASKAKRILLRWYKQ